METHINCLDYDDVAWLDEFKKKKTLYTQLILIWSLDMSLNQICAQ